MPVQDKTGPLGQGPQTGRGLGLCGLGLRRYFGQRCQLGFGWRRFIGGNVSDSKEEQLKDISEYKKALEEELNDVVKKEEELKK